MSAFEFYFSFFGLLLGLSAAVAMTGLADALRARKAVKLGWLTPMLALLVIIDISTFWVTSWIALQGVTITYASIFLGLLIALPYFLAASMVFPKDATEWETLDDYFDTHKRYVLGGVLFANAVGFFSSVMGGLEIPPLRWALISLFFILLILPMIIRNGRINLGLMGLHCLVNIAPAFVSYG
ncbi:hypothetical protein [Brevundimonas aveniformis]|uniref:hypothetical protein n=1 Tax=Brevundimonas aveniformis TaxID=370977 RepID=UPI000412C769|nr:hypothetical protein [Brevundimonas aveniformis]